MKKKSVKAAFYAGAVILACFYLLVLWWGKNPDVGLEYRMYYLTHELSDWPGYGKLSYEPGTTEYCTTLKDKDGNERSINVCRRKGKGWKEDQYEGSTNSGKDAYLYYVLTARQRMPPISVKSRSLRETAGSKFTATTEKLEKYRVQEHLHLKSENLRKRNVTRFILWQIM